MAVGHTNPSGLCRRLSESVSMGGVCWFTEAQIFVAVGCDGLMLLWSENE